MPKRSTAKTPALLGAAAALGLVVGPAATAQEPPVARTPLTAPFTLTLGYDGSLLVKVLDIQLNAEVAAHNFRTSARLRTSGLLALFKKLDMRAGASGYVEGARVKPYTFQYLNTDGHKDRKVQVSWTGSEVTTTSAPVFPTLGDPPATPAQKLEAADPLTQLMRLTLTPANEEPCRGVMHFFDGKQRYDVSFDYRGTYAPDSRERGLGLVAPVRCTIQYREVAGYKKKKLADQGEGLREDVTIGLARVGAGGPWVMSYLAADTQFGRARILLHRLKAS